VFEAAMTSRSSYLHQTLTMLIKSGATIPIGSQLFAQHPNRRDIITIAIMNDDPRISALVLHAPQHRRAVWCAHPHAYGDPDTMKWEHIPSLGSKPNYGVARLIAQQTREDPLLSAVQLGGQGLTVGVDGGSHWPRITVSAVAAASSLSKTAEHMLPWLIWAYGVDLTAVVMRPSIYATSELWAESPYQLNNILQMLDPNGYDLDGQHDPITGELIPQPLSITDTCKWIPMRCIDIAKSPLTGRLVIRLTSLHLNLFDE
jgi:hypothetical protein